MSQLQSIWRGYLKIYSQTTPIRNFCSYISKDVAKVNQAASPDFLMQNLKSATNTNHLLDMVSQHHKIMNNKHIMQALRSVFTLQKQGDSDISTRELMRHPNFKKLCHTLKKQSGSIELNETIEALKVMTYIGVPSDSTISQVLLQLIRHDINNMNLHHIMFLEFLLTQFKPSPLVEALKIALPIVFEIHLPTKMDRENLGHLCEYLYYASRNNLSEETIKLIIRAITMCPDKVDTQQMKSIVWSLSDAEPKAYFEPVLRKALDELTLNLDELSFTDIETTLAKLISAYSKKYPFYYNEVLCDSVINYVIDKDLGYKNGIYILRKLRRVHHWNKYILDYLTKKIIQDPTLVTQGDPFDIFVTLECLAETEYRPPGWETVKELVENHPNLANSRRKDLLWLKFGATLTSLKIFNMDVLDKAIDTKTLEALFQRNYYQDFSLYFSICHAIKLFKPELSHLIDDNGIFPEDLVKTASPIPDYPLEGALHSAFGGEKYVKNGLLSKIGYQIDHTIVFRKGGFPVSLPPSYISYVEDLETSDNQIVLILCLRSSHYPINCRSIKSPTQVSIKMLEECGYAVVPICLEVYEELQDYEKIPYLVQAVNTKINSTNKITQHSVA